MTLKTLILKIVRLLVLKFEQVNHYLVKVTLHFCSDFTELLATWPTAGKTVCSVALEAFDPGEGSGAGKPENVP